MRKPFLILQGTILLLFYVTTALAGNLYTVHLGDFSSFEEVLQAMEQTGWINDLWHRKTADGYALNAGIFPQKAIAETMRKALSETGIKGGVIQTSMPKRDEWSATPYTLTLRAIGNNNPVLLSGANPYRIFHFPWNNSFDIHRTHLLLRLQAAQFLRPESSITISVEGIPLRSLPASEARPDNTITLDLSLRQDIKIGSTLDVAISGTLSAHQDRCLDLLSNDLWLLVLPESSIQTVRRWPPDSPATFMDDPVMHFNFPAISQTRQTVDALVRIAGIIGSTSGSVQSRLHFTPYSLHQRNIFIGSYGDDLQVLGSNLYITPAGARLLASTWRPALLYRQFTAHVAKAESTSAKSTISFDELGIPQRTARGRGDLLFFINLSPLDLGGWPDKLIGTLVYSHTPVTKDERAFLRIRLNGILIDSRELKGQGGRQDITFNIPTHYFKEKNSLEFAFSYYINKGDCLGSYPDFEVALFNDSYFTITGYIDKPPVTLSTFPALAQGHGSLIVNPIKPELYKSAARLVEILGFKQQRVPDIALAQLPLSRTNPPAYTVLISEDDPNGGPDPLVRVAPHFIIKNPLTETVLLDVTTKEPVTILQTYYEKASQVPILQFSRRKSAIFPEDSITEIFSSNPRANVAVIHNDQWQAMEVGKKFRVVYPDRRSISYYWIRYRLIIFVVIGAALLGFLLYIYHRLAKEN